METRLDQFLLSLNRHRVALVGVGAAVMLGGMTGGFLKPAGLLEEPMAAQLIASQALAANTPPPLVLEEFPTNAANRPWVAGTDYAELAELPRIRTAYIYEEPVYDREAEAEMPLPDSTPSAFDRAYDAVAQESVFNEPAA